MLLFMFIIGFISYAASSLFLSFPAIYAAWFYPPKAISANLHHALPAMPG